MADTQAADPRAADSLRRSTPGAATFSLRRPLLVFLAAGLVLWALAQFTSLHLLIGRSYREFESRDGLTNAMRLDGFLSRETKRLRRIARDWGYWDDAYAFLQGRNPTFPNQLFDDQTFGNNAIDLTVMARPDGAIAYERHVDSETLERRTGGATEVRGLLASEAARRVMDEKREITGLLRTDDGLLVFAAVPVLKNQRRGAAAGILVYGRDLDEHVLEEARQDTILDVAILAAGQPGWPADAERLWQDVDQSPQHVARPLGEDRLGAYVVLRDYTGQPVGLLRAVSERGAKASFEAMGLSLFAVNLGLGALLALGFAWLLERRVHEPLAAIRHVLGGVLNDGDFSRRVPALARRDEFASLGEEINGMLGEAGNQRSLREARDSALARAVEKSRFLASMGHEVRTPMNSILGMLELVLESALSPQQQERVNAAYRAAEGLHALLNDIVDYSKLEDGALELEEREFDLRELVESVALQVAPDCERKGLSLSCFVDPRIGRLRGDPLRVRQVVSNLVGNAVKFTVQGEVTVEVKPAAEGGCVEFVVADTGIGIAPGQRGTLFQPFAQVDSASARRFGGTGLGLAISKRLAERMAGGLEVASAPGSGSRFACTLRLPPADTAVAAKAPRGYAGKHALVLGPRDGTRAAVAAYLEVLGFTVRIRPQSGAMPLREHGQVELLVLDETVGATAASVLRAEAARLRVPTLRLVPLPDAQRATPRDRPPAADTSQALCKPVLFAGLEAALERLYAPGQEVAGSDAPAQPAPDVLAGKRILLVEDNAVNMALALGMLEAYSLSVDCAENGAEALAKLGESRFDLVLMDCQMPEMDGLEATRRWRVEEARRGAPRVPIVALTANAMSGDRERCLACGMDDYLSKPFTRARLTGVLRGWLGAAPPAAAPA